MAILLVVVLWKRYETIIFAGALSLVGYFAVIISTGANYETWLFDVLIITFMTLITSRITKTSHEYWLKTLNDEDILEKRTGKMRGLFPKIVQGTKEQAEELKAMDIKFKDLFDSSPDCIKVLDTNGKLLLLNKGGLAEHGFKSIGDTLGWDYLATISEEYVPSIKEALSRAANGGTVSLDVSHKQGGGIVGGSNRAWCNMTFSPSRDASGRIQNVLAVSKDISERKMAEEKLRETTEETERMNKLMVGRELKVIELKEELKKLKEQAGGK
jgi:PAS domain S-box-containing protein